MMLRRALMTFSMALCAISFALPSADTAAAEEVDTSSKPRLGLFTTLPIYWGEFGAFGALLDSSAKQDWVRSELERDFEIVLLDTLEPDALAGVDKLLLAQPRPLAPSENVSLDQFLAEGGIALIMADPMLTRHSDYAFGDRMRPQDVVLLSPILARLGAALEYDDRQSKGMRTVETQEGAFPVNLPGRFKSIPSDVSPHGCAIDAETQIRARCDRGEGTAYLFADAALLDWEGDSEAVPESQRIALRALLAPLLPKTAK